MEVLIMFEKVREIMVDNLGLDPSEISLDSNLQDDLDIDSLDAVELGLKRCQYELCAR